MPSAFPMTGEESRSFFANTSALESYILRPVRGRPTTSFFFGIASISSDVGDDKKTIFMDPLVPGGALGGAAALSASTARDALLEKLRTGEWTYPETGRRGELSVVFDLILVLAFVLLWGWATFFPVISRKGLPDSKAPDRPRWTMPRGTPSSTTA